MVAKTIHLRDFPESELIFDEQETRDILKFFFQSEHPLIDSAQITDELRNLAQGLLVEAIDASYALGWIDLTFTWVTKPTMGLRKALQKLAQKAIKYWWKHYKNKSLLDAKIYECIRKELARSFHNHIKIVIEARFSGKHNLVAIVNYGARA